jgi:hypothetical protein
MSDKLTKAESVVAAEDFGSQLAQEMQAAAAVEVALQVKYPCAACGHSATNHIADSYNACADAGCLCISYIERTVFSNGVSTVMF